jgi:tetratricopeptide (TPR) repeat protein
LVGDVLLRPFVLTLVLAIPALVLAQPAAECPGPTGPEGPGLHSCAPQAAPTNPVHRTLWQDAAAVHQLKVAFVEVLQRFVRAQAGTFGDEGDELRRSLGAMQDALSRWDSAIHVFQTQSSRTHDAESSMALATVLLDRHRIDDALRALAAAEQFDDTRADLYAMRALALGASNRPDEAVRALRRAVALDARDPSTAYALVQHLSQLNRPDDAERARRALQRSLASPRHVAFARVDLLSQRPGAAPIFPQARYASGFAALDSGDYGAALARFTEAMSSDPLSAGSLDAHSTINEAAAALRSGRIDGALQRLQSAAASSPESSEVHRLLGVTYWVDEQTGKSIEHLRTAIRLAPSDERARVLLSDVLAEDRRLAEAERELQLATEAGQRSGQIAYRLAQVYQRQSTLPRAVQAFAESESFGPIIGRDHFYQAWAGSLVNQADFNGAAAVYAKRIAVNANSADAHRQLGEIYFLQGRHDEALGEFLVATWLDPKDAKAHAAAGQSYVRLAKSAEAIAALQRALALDGSLREARYALGTALMRTGKTEDARRELDLFARQQADAEAVGQREFQLDALRRQAAKAALAGNHEQALAHCRDVAAIDPGARSQRDLGLALLRAKRFGDAIEPLRAAQQMDETAEGFVYLIDALSAMGETVEAGRQRERHQQHLARVKMERVKALGGR